MSYSAALSYSCSGARSRELHAKLGMTPTGSGNSEAEGPMGNVGALAVFNRIKEGDECGGAAAS